jgi:hypothetical protein
MAAPVRNASQLTDLSKSLVDGKDLCSDLSGQRPTTTSESACKSADGGRAPDIARFHRQKPNIRPTFAIYHDRAATEDRSEPQ